MLLSIEEPQNKLENFLGQIIQSFKKKSSSLE
jgi:hypothetical protein